MQSSHTFSSESAVFDEQNLVSAAGLVPVLELAEQTGLSRLIGEHVDLPSTRVRSGAVNPAGKLTTIIAGMMCGAHSIDDANLLRAGGTPRVFDEVYAPSTVGILLREFTFGHSNQLAAVARAHLIALAQRTALLPGTDERMFLDIDSLLRPVYGHQKQGASFGHAKIAGRALLRKGLSPLITTLSTPTAAPVIAEAWLRSGKTGSGRGAARQLKQAITTARAIDPDATIMARGDSAFGTKKVIAACLSEHVEFSLSLSRNRRVTKAIEAIDDDAFTPVHYPGAVLDPDSGALISDAEVAETTHTLTVRGHGRLTARLVVRRVRDARYPDALFPVWRYHYRLRKVRFNHGRDTATETAGQGCVATAESHPTRRTSAKASTASARTPPRCARSRAGPRGLLHRQRPQRQQRQAAAPEWDRLLADIEAGKIDAVAAWDQDRELAHDERTGRAAEVLHQAGPRNPARHHRQRRHRPVLADRRADGARSRPRCPSTRSR